MCEKCVEIDETIARYRRLARSTGDQSTIDQVEEMAKEMEAQKTGLHPEEEQ